MEHAEIYKSRTDQFKQNIRRQLELTLLLKKKQSSLPIAKVPLHYISSIYGSGEAVVVIMLHQNPCIEHTRNKNNLSKAR